MHAGNVGGEHSRFSEWGSVGTVIHHEELHARMPSEFHFQRFPRPQFRSFRILQTNVDHEDPAMSQKSKSDSGGGKTFFRLRGFPLSGRGLAPAHTGGAKADGENEPTTQEVTDRVKHFWFRQVEAETIENVDGDSPRQTVLRDRCREPSTAGEQLQKEPRAMRQGLSCPTMLLSAKTARQFHRTGGDRAGGKLRDRRGEGSQVREAGICRRRRRAGLEARPTVQGRMHTR